MLDPGPDRSRKKPEKAKRRDEKRMLEHQTGPRLASRQGARIGGSLTMSKECLSPGPGSGAMRKKVEKPSPATKRRRLWDVGTRFKKYFRCVCFFFLSKSPDANRKLDPQDQRFHENVYLRGRGLDATWNKKYFRMKQYVLGNYILVFLSN